MSIVAVILERVQTVGVGATVRLLARTLYHVIARAHRIRFRRCRCCGSLAPFLPVHIGDEGIRCLRCGANRRYEMLAALIRERYGSQLAQMDVVELDPHSPLRGLLAGARRYTRTYYASAGRVPLLERGGAELQDCTRFTWPDASVELIVSSDVLEHVPDLDAALRESARVLRPGGVHLFTVPTSPRTRRRAALDGHGRIEHLVGPEYHLDPLNPEGVLVFWDIGPDLCDRAGPGDFSVAVVRGPEGPDQRLVWALTKAAAGAAGSTASVPQP